MKEVKMNAELEYTRLNLSLPRDTGDMTKTTFLHK